MWQTEGDVANRDDDSKMMFSHPIRRTKFKNKIAEMDQIQKNKIEPKNIFLFLFPKPRD
jgi:hypothetical protein